MIKRFFDIVFSMAGIVLLSPVLLILWLLIRTGSKGPALFKQNRVGIHNHDFTLLKFRTMYADAEKRGQLTVGMRDPRITPVGYYLRKFKLDELPQLFNVLRGDMSLVGPRPEVRRYVDLYNAEQMKVLTVRPGITDFASIIYFKENEILGKAADPEQTYIREIMPEKLRINLEYVRDQSLKTDVYIIFKTIFKIIS